MDKPDFESPAPDAIVDEVPTDELLERPPSGERGFRISRLAKKELRETLRDRRTLVTLILMPLLVYPILSLVFRTFLLNTADSMLPPEEIGYRFVIAGDVDEEQLTMIVKQINELNKRTSAFNNQRAKRDADADDEHDADANAEQTKETTTDDEDPASKAEEAEKGRLEDPAMMNHRWSVIDTDIRSIEDVVATGDADVGLRFETKDKRRFQLAKYSIVYDPENYRSVEAADYLTRNFLKFNQSVLMGMLRARRLPAFAPLEALPEQTVVGAKKEEKKSGISMASLIPLILVLMTITGAVYPAIDLTAGERERGTLETLMAAPIPRMGILFSKFIAVLTVAVLTASLNIIGMATTIWAFQLDSFLGESGFTVAICLKVFALLVLFASFYSAVLLAVTSYARSFKEAQSYLVPIILLSMAPGLMAMSPGLSLAGPLCVTPMVNILLLGRDVLQENVQPIPSLIAIVSTLFYTALSVLMAARVFGTDAILYGSQTSWTETFRRPISSQKTAPLVVVAFCLVLLFPINFLLIGFLGRFDASMDNRLMLMALFTFLTFGVFPWLVARHQRVETASGFGFRNSRFVYLFAALLLGVSLWPIVMSVISAWHDIYALFAGAEQSQAWHDRLVKFSSEQAVRLREVPPWVIAVTLSIVPAVCEEWFFRGFLLRALLKHKSKWTAILISALVFGLFHVLSNSVVALDRLVPTTLIGIILGYLSYKSGSIIPGIILHSIHNGVIAFLSYYQPQLSQFEWFPDAAEPIPMVWVLAALAPALIGVWLMGYSKRHGLVEKDVK